MKRIWTAAKEFYNSKYCRFKSREDLLEWQQGKLQSHLDWVCENSPFYRECRQLPLYEYPLMDKASMMDNFNQINTLGLDRDELFDIALKAENNREFDASTINNVTVGMSSGTSGRRGLFVVSKEEQAQWAGYIIGRLMPSILRSQRISLLLRANSNLYQSVGYGHIKFQYTDLCEPVDGWLAKLEAYNPTIIVGSAQALLMACREGRGLTPELVISGAEVLTPEDKCELHDRFGCQVKEVYQCTEGFLASTHSDGNMRWNEDLVHIEKQWINKEKTHFQPIVTDFRRRSQPVIRYLMDDIILPSGDNGIFSGIDSIVGRSGDILEVQKIKVLPDLIYNAVSRSIGNSVNYQISQVGEYQLKINSDHSGLLIEKALRSLLTKVGVAPDCPLTFIHEGSPSLDLSAKHRRVVNLCKPQQSQVVFNAA